MMFNMRVDTHAKRGSARRYAVRMAYGKGKLISKLKALVMAAVMPAALLALVLLSPSANSEAIDEKANDLVHSDLPIFGHGGDNEWPQHFSDGASFGCASRVAFGDWAFRKRRAKTEDEVLWYRFSNYGVFHCWANTFRAYERVKLDDADFHPSFFVFLESAKINGREIELWTVQIGARPGSEYLLLSRDPAKGKIEKFNVLQAACPPANVRDAGSLDILSTRYCAVNSRDELIGLIRLMAQRPPLGTVTRVSFEKEKDEGTHE